MRRVPSHDAQGRARPSPTSRRRASGGSCASSARRAHSTRAGSARRPHPRCRPGRSASQSAAGCCAAAAGRAAPATTDRPRCRPPSPSPSRGAAQPAIRPTRAGRGGPLRALIRRSRPRSPRQVKAVPTNAQLKIERALELFNASEHPRTVAGLARTLGISARRRGDLQRVGRRGRPDGRVGALLVPVQRRPVRRPRPGAAARPGPRAVGAARRGAGLELPDGGGRDDHLGSPFRGARGRFCTDRRKRWRGGGPPPIVAKDSP